MENTSAGVSESTLSSGCLHYWFLNNGNIHTRMQIFFFPVMVTDVDVLNRVGKGLQYLRQKQKGISKSTQWLQCSLPSASLGGAELTAGLI